jgi:hypothetical protein
MHSHQSSSRLLSSPAPLFAPHLISPQLQSSSTMTKLVTATHLTARPLYALPNRESGLSRWSSQCLSHSHLSFSPHCSSLHSSQFSSIALLFYYHKPSHSVPSDCSSPVFTPEWRMNCFSHLLSQSLSHSRLLVFSLHQLLLISSLLSCTLLLLSQA